MGEGGSSAHTPRTRKRSQLALEVERVLQCFCGVLSFVGCCLPILECDLKALCADCGYAALAHTVARNTTTQAEPEHGLDTKCPTARKEMHILRLVFAAKKTKGNACARAWDSLHILQFAGPLICRAAPLCAQSADPDTRR